MSWRALETVGWVVLYLGFAVFALTVEHAGTTYRQVFIARTAADWVPGADLGYPPGTIIRGDEPSPYYGVGWWRPAPQGRWGRGGFSTIVVRPTSDLPAGSRLRAQIGAFVVPPGNVAISIAVNGETVGAVTLTDRDQIQLIDLPLPAPLSTGQDVEISFSDPSPASAMTAHLSPDARQRGVHLVELALVPKAGTS